MTLLVAVLALWTLLSVVVATGCCLLFRGADVLASRAEAARAEQELAAA